MFQVVTDSLAAHFFTASQEALENPEEEAQTAQVGIYHCLCVCCKDLIFLYVSGGHRLDRSTDERLVASGGGGSAGGSGWHLSLFVYVLLEP